MSDNTQMGSSNIQDLHYVLLIVMPATFHQLQPCLPRIEKRPWPSVVGIDIAIRRTITEVHVSSFLRL